ncbi:hypothetical protein PHLGIDRAFT_324716 [Phlebiopsis gigantea 11061_1 CR5-6]|uniref:Uncharacterized protein n=1 Tax=Phlebiopsis gigantea (strain 11061_1 CR5-6) TaxID=745531 RepID=A0A0C3PAN0_PHLG1|nr:hypothetical protein PHLGIDRAFT_324716 [Phlebiopsis gigantea 11061_1 CR5-6]
MLGNLQTMQRQTSNTRQSGKRRQRNSSKTFGMGCGLAQCNRRLWAYKYEVLRYRSSPAPPARSYSALLTSGLTTPTPTRSRMSTKQTKMASYTNAQAATSEGVDPNSWASVANATLSPANPGGGRFTNQTQGGTLPIPIPRDHPQFDLSNNPRDPTFWMDNHWNPYIHRRKATLSAPVPPRPIGQQVQGQTLNCTVLPRPGPGK